jgi:hypothetical protein
MTGRQIGATRKCCSRLSRPPRGVQTGRPKFVAWPVASAWRSCVCARLDEQRPDGIERDGIDDGEDGQTRLQRELLCRASRDPRAQSLSTALDRHVDGRAIERSHRRDLRYWKTLFGFQVSQTDVSKALQ